MNNKYYKSQDELNINVNFTLNENYLKNLNYINNIENFKLNFYSKNYYKKSRGRKKFKEEHLYILSKIYYLFGENLTIAKIFLPFFNLNQIYSKFQYLKYNQFKVENNVQNIIESFESFNILKIEKKQSEYSSNLNLDAYVQKNKNNYRNSIDILPSIQSINENDNKSQFIRSFKIKENTNDSLKSINNFEKNCILYDILKYN